jgi:hypothetical protein
MGGGRLSLLSKLRGMGGRSLSMSRLGVASRTSLLSGSLGLAVAVSTP